MVEYPTHGGGKLFKCQYVSDDGTRFTSADMVYRTGPNKRSLSPLKVGMVSTPVGPFYDTTTHAKFALLMSVLYSRDPTSIESSFLYKQDYVQIIPRERWAFDIHNGPNVERTIQPIACFLRSGSHIVCLDMEYLRLLDFERESKFAEPTQSGNGNEFILRDRTKQYFCDVTKQWTTLPPPKLKYFEMKLPKQNNHHSDAVNYIALADFGAIVQLPRNTTRTELCVDFPQWIKVTSMSGNRKVEYWYSPRRKYKLRSRREVEFFINLLSEYEGSEDEVISVWEARNVVRKDNIDDQK